MSRPEIPVFITAITRNADAALKRFTTLARTSAVEVTAAFGRVRSAALSVGALGGALGLAGVVASARQAASDVAAIGDEARRAGISVKAFQELRFVAEQNRVGVDAMIDGLKELSLRADEFIVTGGGAGAEAFQRLGLDAQALKTKLEDPSALFTEIIGKLGQLDTAAQIRIADEVFGGAGGEQFVQLIEQGEAGIRAQIKAANDLGIVIEDDLVKRAAEVDRQFNLIANTVGMTLKSAIVSAADSLSEFIDGFRDYQNQMTGTLSNKQAEIGERRLELENKILAAQGNGALNERARNKAVGQYRAELEKLTEEDAQITGILNDRLSTMNRSAERTWTPPVSPPGGFGSTSKSTRRREKSAADEYQELIDKAREFIAEQGIEQQAIGLTAAAAGNLRFEHALLNEARRAGIDLSPAQADALRTLASEMSAAEQETIRLARSQEELQERYEAFEDVAAGTTRSFVQGLLDGEKATEALRGAVSRLGDALLDSAFASFFGTGGPNGGGIFKSLFGPLFGLPGNAKGTNNWRGGLTWVGESGPELLNVRPGAQLIPNQTLAALSKMEARERSGVTASQSGAAGTSEPVVVSFAPVYNVQGSGPEIEQLRKQMAKDRAEFEGRVKTIVSARSKKGW